MKKFVKVCLIIAAVLAVAGISFCIAGAVCGVDYEKLREFPVYRERIREIVVPEDSEGEKDFEGAYSGIRELKLDINIAAVYLVDSDDDRFHVIGDDVDSSFQCRQEEDALKVEVKGKVKSYENQMGRITIEVPEGTVLEEAELKVGMGLVQADSLYCEELHIDCGMGSVSVNGSVYGDCEVNCGVGEVTLNLDNKEGDFDYDVKCGIGEVVLGENSYSGLARTKEINNGAEKDMDIDCGVGSVMITFDKE